MNATTKTATISDASRFAEERADELDGKLADILDDLTQLSAHVVGRNEDNGPDDITEDTLSDPHTRYFAATFLKLAWEISAARAYARQLHELHLQACTEAKAAAK